VKDTFNNRYVLIRYRAADTKLIRSYRELKGPSILMLIPVQP